MNLASISVRCAIAVVFTSAAMCFSAEGDPVSAAVKPDVPALDVPETPVVPAAAKPAEPAKSADEESVGPAVSKPAQPAVAEPATPVAEKPPETPTPEKPGEQAVEPAGPPAAEHDASPAEKPEVSEPEPEPVKEVVGPLEDLQTIDEQIGAAMASTNDVIKAMKMVLAQDEAIKLKLQAVSNIFTHAEKPMVAAAPVVRDPDPPVTVADVPAGEPAADPGTGQVGQGMEDSGHWQRESWADKGSASVQGGVLVVETIPGQHGKTAVTRGFDDPLVINPTDAVTVDVDNRGATTIQVALALFQGYTYFESAAQNVKSGTTSLTYKMSAKTFKSAATQWEPKGSFNSPFAVNKITLLIYASKPAEAAFDNLLLGPTGN